MYTFFLMLVELFKYHNLHWFVVFIIFIYLRWAIVYFHALKYRPVVCENKPFFSSVIIPVVDESEELFCSVLEKITEQEPDELIVVINGPENKPLEKICQQTSEQCAAKGKRTDVKWLWTETPGKRNAIRLGVEAMSVQSDICILVDSDTLWSDHTLENLLMPFSADEKNGGVTSRQHIYKPDRSLVTMFASVLEEVRAEGTMKAMSATGKVGCLPGRTIAFRSEIVRKVMPEFLHETFLGIHKEVSDDRSLTNLTLKQGYKTVMQDTAVVYTDAPVTWKKFFRQQLRWAEGSQYNNLYMTPWMIKNAKLMCFIFWTDMIMPFMLMSVYLSNIICFILRLMGRFYSFLVYPFPLPVTVLLIIIGSVFGFGSRNIRIMKSLPLYYIFLFPIIVLVLSLFMAPIRILGLMRCADGLPWGTRELTVQTKEGQQ